MSDPKDRVRDGYNRLADEYVRHVYDELRHKPFDRERLDRFAARLRNAGPVCDLGCGPGQVTRYLHERGVHITGIDLSDAMIVRARRLNPGIDFSQGDLTALTVADEAWAGIIAFYSLIHVPREFIPATLRGLYRVLRPGGLLFLAFHVGTDTLRVADLWNVPVVLDFHFFQSDEITDGLRDTGFLVEDTVERDPYPEIEAQTRRAYILARKPDASP